MFNSKIILCLFLFTILHIFIWFSNNMQFMASSFKDKSMFVAIFLAIPCAVVAYYAYRFGYYAFESFWTVRFLGFGISYLVFPVLTWFFLSESPFNIKTILCTILSFCIIIIQLFVPSND